MNDPVLNKQMKTAINKHTHATKMIDNPNITVKRLKAKQEANEAPHAMQLNPEFKLQIKASLLPHLPDGFTASSQAKLKVHSDAFHNETFSQMIELHKANIKLQNDIISNNKKEHLTIVAAKLQPLHQKLNPPTTHRILSGHITKKPN
jgi:hypothetical protein